MINKKYSAGWVFSFIIIIAVFSLSCGRVRHRRKRTIRKRGVYHVVKKSQTLWRIAKTYGVKLKILARANGISDTSKIKEGRKIFIPGAKSVKKVAVYKTLPLKKVPTKRKRKKVHLTWPVKGKFTSSFGVRKNRRHDGIDIAAPTGSYIKASASGKVIFSGWGPSGYGKIVIIKHSGEFVTVYAHNKKNIVKKGQKVKKGQHIAKVGSTGRSTGPHLHFEVRRNKIPEDPLIYLP